MRGCVTSSIRAIWMSDKNGGISLVNLAKIKLVKAEFLFQQVRQKKSLLCIGLDTDPQKIPSHLHKEADPVFAFNKAIVEATHDLAIAYKPNIAFYEAQGPKGWESLARTLEVIPDEVMVIADAKRGDIGNTSRMYAQTFFEQYDFDAITVAPYMGSDSVGPFLEFEEKWVFLLGLTSNPGAQDFQFFPETQPLYQRVLTTAQTWPKATGTELGFVVGATKAEKLQEIRALAPEAWLLVPGVGAQGGSVEAVCQHGMNDRGGLLINSSRGIIYAGKEADFAEQARKAAYKLQSQMQPFVEKL